MSDNSDNASLTPLSSNSSGSSGTRAWSVSVVEETANPQPDETASTAPDQSESISAPKVAPMTDNESRQPVTEEVDLPVTEDDLPASEEAEPIAAEAEQASEDEDVIASKDSVEAVPQTETAAPVSDTGTETGETETFAEAMAMAASDEPDNETGFSESVPEPAAEEQTTEELRQAVLASMTEHEESQKETFALFERMSEDFSAMMATARNDAAVFSIKLMEFAQANAQNSFELARAYSHARSMPEILNVQADYLKRQMELLNTQARELQALTAKVTARNTMEIQNRHSAT